MSDIEIVKEIESTFNVKLAKLDSTDWDTVTNDSISSSIEKSFEIDYTKMGYVINKDRNIVSLKLRKVNIAESMITHIKQLNYLEELIVRNCDLSEIDAIQSLTNLKVLDISGNKITNVSILSKLSKLKVLILSNNKIKRIDSLRYLKDLRVLQLAENQITDISSLSELNNLTYLNLMSNKLSSMDVISKLEKIQEVDLVNNSIHNIPALDKCSNITDLILGKNKITDISSLKTASNLQRLILYENLVEDISPLKELYNIRMLNLSHNYIKDISPIENLINLEWLPLGNNQIADITPLKRLNKLWQLDLKNNPIKQLPVWITDFNMKIVWQDELVGVSGCINFFNNPINNPPVGIIKQGNDAIIRYFNKIQDEGIDYIYEAKLTLVGEGSAGKTSLQTRLINPKKALPKEENRTRGIKIYDWIFKKSKGRNKIAHIWDFGGQDVYYPVHRFFLTENSIFVLLASTRHTHHNFDYWIPTIYQFGGKSPIILGQTCHQGNKIPWNDIGYYLSNPHFNIIKSQELPYQEINLPYKNEGLQKIKKIIISQIEALPHYGKGVPTSWIPIRNILSEKSETTACLSFEAFSIICKESNRKAFSTTLDIEDCAKFLHSIGVILWYSDIENLRDWVILQPAWAMNAVYKIIDDDEIQRRKGLILSKDFHRLWADEEYDTKHLILKKMLEVFKIAFPKKHKKEEYIIPARLPSLSSADKWQDNEPYLRLIYVYEFLPKGLINQLSSELSRYIQSDSQVWNNAVNFSNEGSTAEAQVQEDFYNRKFYIKAKGKDARGLTMIIMDALKNITDDYKGVIPEIFVPCTCSNCRTSSDPTTYLYTKLVKWAFNKDNPKVTCNESGDSLLIEDLLFNVGLPYLNTYKSQNMSTKTITIFLASSSELKEDRMEFEIFINRENKRLNKDGIFLELNLWEDFIDAMSKTRLQDEYNKVVQNSDIFISLFCTKVGKFTAEEFETAFATFNKGGRPYVYTFFKKGTKDISEIRREDINSKFDFEEKLKSLGHFPTTYKNIEDLKYQFKSQLDKILPQLI